MTICFQKRVRTCSAVFKHDFHLHHVMPFCFVPASSGHTPISNMCIQNLYSTPTRSLADTEVTPCSTYTYLTESGSLPVSERRVKSAMTKRTSSCSVEPRKKTVHFVATSVEETDVSDSSPLSRCASHDSGGVLKHNRRLDHHPRVKPTLAEARRKASHELLMQRSASDVTQAPASQRHVINLSHYLNDRALESDAESQCADSDTTTSGSYCCDDDDLAHDVLV